MVYEFRIHHVDGLCHHVCNSGSIQEGYNPKHTETLNAAYAKAAADPNNQIRFLFGWPGNDPVCGSCPHYDGNCLREPEPTEADRETTQEMPALEIGRVYTVAELKEVLLQH